jgi:hypothetical protein
MVELILTRTQFVDFARRMGVRPDWHEPDEQALGSRVEGCSFDNAGFWPGETARMSDERSVELHVIFSRMEVGEDGWLAPVEDIAAVNLATLCSWAAGFEEIERV